MRLIHEIIYPGHHLWCPGFLEAEGKVWLFASAWPFEHGFSGWRAHSRIVFAEIDLASGRIIGTFKILEPLGAGRILHNPRAISHDGQIILYFSENVSEQRYKIGGAILNKTNMTVIETCEDIFPKSILGQNLGESQGATNPAPFVRPDNSLAMIIRLSDGVKTSRKLIQAKSKTPFGPWSLEGPVDPDPESDLEDPMVWRDQAGFKMLMHDMVGTVSEKKWPSIGCLRSDDGKSWKPSTLPHMFNRALPLKDGSAGLFYRTERPFTLSNKQGSFLSFGAITALESQALIRLYDWAKNEPYLVQAKTPTAPQFTVKLKASAAAPPEAEKGQTETQVDHIQTRKLSYLKTERLNSLVQEMERLTKSGAAGLVVEFGVALGGSGALMASKLPKSMKFVGYDVFGQIPPPDDNDSERSHERYAIIDSGQSKGLSGDVYYGYRENLLDEVKANFATLGAPVDGDRVSLIQGLFRDTVNFPDGSVIRLAHIDCDWYDPTLFCLESVAPHIPKWGTILRPSIY